MRVIPELPKPLNRETMTQVDTSVDKGDEAVEEEVQIGTTQAWPGPGWETEPYP